ncbi:MAG: hypothetical protein E7505_02565 [Ruminococcus sp.]|nr:hypothetical protein [Ruminococcus sp.]
MKTKISMLRTKIINEFNKLSRQTTSALNNKKIDADVILEYSEYFFIKTRIYICFYDFKEFINVNERVIDFLLKKENASDYMTYIFMNGFVGDCDPKSVEGIIKLMIFSFNHAMYKKGKSDSIIPVEVTFPKH